MQGDLSSIPGQGPRYSVLQLKAQVLQLNIPDIAMKVLHAATKTWSNRKKKTKKTNNYLSFKRGKGFKQIFLQKEI